MKWKHPPEIKIYEALGAVADGRVKVSGDTAKVYSSSRNKYYTVTYDAEKHAIMANDNGSYWQGYLGYPAIAFLMKTGVLSYDAILGKLLAGIPWKDINQKFKNNFEKTREHILSNLSQEERTALADFVVQVTNEIMGLNLNLLGKKTLPPQGY